jgi:hypothetical protein
MNGRVWLNYFIKVCKDLEERNSRYDGEWTEVMGKVLDVVGEKMHCVTVRKRGEFGREYLNIDAFYFDNSEYDLPVGIGDEEDPFVLPTAVVELENSLETNKITYCAWKLLCICSPIRVLVCYQKGMNNITSLAMHLEDVIWQRGLMKHDAGDLLVIIGNDKKSDSNWEDYYSIFEWRNDKLEKIEDLEW